MTKAVCITDGLDPSSVYDNVLSRVTESDDYVVRNEGENMLGEKRINVTRGGLKYKIIAFEGFGDEYPEGTLVRITVPSGTFEEGAEVDPAAALDALIETTKEVYTEIDAPEKAAYGIEDRQPMIAPMSGDDLSPPGRTFLTWLNIFPPIEVETIGRDTVSTAPAEKIEQLDDGSVLLVSKHPATVDPDPLDEVADHVGIRSWEDYPHERASGDDFEE